ncbi:MAG: ATP synthase F1 subunit gamma [Desulfobacteraceae bacterium]|nr:ATP synthase F1 subunit gamma [Desulfobacteraceae bacterium]MCB9494498.1 ATP synthase F1 subunit gamma [Desulfobacteraceae bacterium]
MATLKDLKLKITGVKKTKQITKAMNMVAASRLRGSQRKIDAFRPYAEKYTEVLKSLAEKATNISSKLLEPRDEIKSVHIIVCTSDRGLCGAFNESLLDKTQELVKKNFDKNIKITAFGKKGRDWAGKKGIEVLNSYLNVVGTNFGFEVAERSGNDLINLFLSGEADEVYMVYSEFQSMSRQVPSAVKILPIERPVSDDDIEEASEEGYLAEHICEPSPEFVLQEMLPRSVQIQIFRGLLETSASEHAARMVAMDNATRACNDMIKDLNKLYNKTRQAAVTADLMDIVGGAEALKG